MGYTFTRKKGQKIIILNDQAMPLSIIEMQHRKHDTAGGINSLRISVVGEKGVIRNDRTRRDGEQFAVGEVVFSIDQDAKSHRAAITIEKNPPYLQVARYEHYKQAMNS